MLATLINAAIVSGVTRKELLERLHRNDFRWTWLPLITPSIASVSGSARLRLD
ncbi:hypothetical protein [Paraburkholderia caffeinilytica]|uniref:hypothetical protein n=1 Tax=Paraburkholderia caffeinilytica TaxID=1761016 RepID=UPI003DA01592